MFDRNFFRNKDWWRWRKIFQLKKIFLAGWVRTELIYFKLVIDKACPSDSDLKISSIPFCDFPWKKFVDTIGLSIFQFTRQVGLLKMFCKIF